MTMRESISDEVMENSRNIEIAGRTLLQTINEILDMSKLETGQMKLTCGDYRTAEMLSEIDGMTRLRAEEKGLAFRIETAPSLPSVLNGDEVRIKQILLNVITNAIKYTKTGFVALEVSSRTDEDGTFRMVYDVTDTGIGIRKEDIPRLFTEFLRVDEQENRAIEGTGLGLSIVKQLLDMMHGTVSVTSTYGKGSTFHIEIPQMVADDTAIGAVDLRKIGNAETADCQNVLAIPELRILAVDDTPMNLMVVKKLLRDTEAMVDTAECGEEALRKTTEHFYDVILMDQQMPEMDGIECLHRIRNQENGLCCDSKIVCLTANAGPEMEQLSMQEGFDGFMTKPVRSATLKKEIARLINSNK
jgi:CheY-like chemotaxis protein